MSKIGPGEAFASWQWLNFLISKVPAGKKVLLIKVSLCVFTYQRQAGSQTGTHAYRHSHMNQWPYITPPWPKGTGHVSSGESRADAALGVEAKRAAAMRRCSRTRLYFCLPANRRHHKLSVTPPPPSKPASYSEPMLGSFLRAVVRETLNFKL